MDAAVNQMRVREWERIADVVALVPHGAETALDAGARDGCISRQLAATCRSVTALDLEQPQIDGENVACVRGDITALGFPDRSFDVVLCTEVLEHLSPKSLQTACLELSRVAKSHLIIGVPYEQDTRIARTTCYTCGATNPPWAHLNSFDRRRLMALFPDMKAEKISFVGIRRERTNMLSTYLLEFAGNPYGSYDQQEPCVHCGARLIPPPERTFFQRVATKLAVKLNGAQSYLAPPQPNWIHVLFSRIN